MSFQTDVVNLLVRVNGDNAKKEFTELKSKAAEISAELKSMKKGTEEYEAKSKELALVQSRFRALRAEMDLNSLSIKDLRQEIAKMKSQRAELDPTSEGFRTLGTRIQTAEARMRELNQGGTFLSRTFDFLKKEAMGFGVVMLGALGIDYVIGKIGNLIQRQSELSDSFAQIRRTTGLSQVAVEDLNKSLSQIDTRTAKKDLRDIAVVLGQIGEPANIESIKAIDKIVVALGDEFHGGADEITSALSILRNNFTAFKTGDYAADIEHIGNALSVLGKTGIATAPVVTDMATRMSGVLGTFKVTAGQTLGLSAAMQEMGISVERGSTAVTKLVQKMAQNPEVFAKVAGAKTKKEIDDFIKLLNEDAVAALLKVAQGSKIASNNTVEYAAILKELESTGAGVSEVLAKFADNNALVKEKVDLATDAIAKNDTIQNSFAISNENVAAKVSKLQKQFAALWESESVTNFLKSAIDGAFNFIEALKSLGRFIESNWFLIKALTAAYIAYFIASGRLISIKTIELALTKAGTTATALQTTATIAYNLVVGLLTLNIGRMASAWRLFTAAMAINPFVAIATAVIGLSVALNGLLEKHRQLQREFELNKIKIKYEADIKDLEDSVKANIQGLTKNINSDNKIKLQVDLEAASGAESLTTQIIGQQEKSLDKLKTKIQEQEDLVKSYDENFSFHLKSTVFAAETKLQKLKSTYEYESQLLDKNKAALQSYTDVKGQITTKITELDNKQAASAKELSDKEKAELDKRRRAHEKYLDDLRKYNDELIKLDDAVEKAKIQAIEEENARELLALEELRKEKIQAAEKAIRDQIERAKDLHILTAALEKEYADKLSFLKLGIEEQYQRDRTALILKHQDERQKQIETSYSNELKLLNNNVETQKLLFAHLYKEGEISKNEYDTRLKNLDVTSKSELLEIAKRYGIDVKKAEQDLLDAEIKIIEDAIERKKALLQREADFRVALAQYNSSKNPNSKDAQEELLRAQLNQLQVQMENEIQLHIGHEEEILQIRAEYNLKKQQLDEEFHAGTIARGADAAAQYIGIFNEAAQKIFDFRGQKIEQELQATQTKISKEQASLDQQYKNKLLSDVDYNARKKANQDKLDKAEREAKRKKAINDKLAAVFNILLQTAQGIATAVAQSPMTGGLPGSAIAAAMGALELAFVAAQPIPQYYTGGYTDKRKVKGAKDGRTYDAKLLPGFGSGYLADPSLVLAGERGEEYFVNNTMLNNPAVKYVVDGIDQLTKGNISSPDFEAMLALPALQQKYTGGYVGTSNTQAPEFKKPEITKDIYGDMLLQVANTLSRLNDHLDSGIKSEAVIRDNTIVKFNERNNYLKSIVDDAN